MNSSITGSVSESSSVLTCVLNTLQHHYTTVTLHLTRYTRYTLSTCLNHVLTALRWMVQTSRHVSGSMQWSGSPRFLGDLHGGFVRIIKDSKSMDNEGLWFLGFFGKGSLSRGVPTWWKRHHHPKGVSQEGIASQKRAHAMADARMTIVSETSSDPEMYILMMEEAVYLVVCDQKLLQVRGSQGNILTIQDLWQQCRLARQSKATLDASEFAIQFAVYRYYQSQGWIVKSGHLFGADYVLYRDGPTRKHSEYAVMVLPVLDAESKSKRPTWQSVQMASRVCSHARKSIILCHVIIPRMLDMSRIECIESIQIWDVAIGRWKPEKGRR